MHKAVLLATIALLTACAPRAGQSVPDTLATDPYGRLTVTAGDDHQVVTLAAGRQDATAVVTLRAVAGQAVQVNSSLCAPVASAVVCDFPRLAAGRQLVIPARHVAEAEAVVTRPGGKTYLMRAK